MRIPAGIGKGVNRNDEARSRLAVGGRMQIFRRVITPRTTLRLRRPVLLLLACLGAGLAAQTENVTKELQITKWSGAINVPDPVSVAVDPQGRVYVTATTRHKVGVIRIKLSIELVLFGFFCHDLNIAKS